MKKNSVLGRVTWLAYSAAVLFSFCYLAMLIAYQQGYRTVWGVVLGAGAVLLVCALINALVQRLLQKRRDTGRDRIKSAVAEGAALVVILAGTLIWRILTIGETEIGACYDKAKVVSDGAYVPDAVNGALNLYLRLLHGVLWVFGNTPTAAAGLQLALFILVLLLLYFGVRSLCGAGAALCATALTALSQLLANDLLEDNPDLLFCLVFFAAFGYIASYWSKWNRTRKQRSFPAAILRCLVTGALIGLGIAMDAAAVVLLPLLLCVLPGGEQKPQEGEELPELRFRNRRPVGLLVTLAAACGAYIGLLCVLGQSPESWLAQYTGNLWLMLPSWLTTSFVSPWTPEILGLAGLLVLGVFTSRNRFGSAESGVLSRGSLILCTLLLIGLQCCGILTDVRVNSYSLLYLLLLIFAGMSIADLFVTRQKTEEKMTVNDAAPSEPAEQPAAEELTAKPEPAEETAQPAKPEPAPVIFLESPLPLPKKHVRREMDYDLEVADDDDYDIR